MNHSKLIKLIVVALCVLSLIVGSYVAYPRKEGRRYDSVSIGDLRKKGQFVGKVEVVSLEGPERLPTIRIGIVSRNGDRVVFGHDEADSSMIQFAKAFVEGQDCHFPRVIDEYEAKSGNRLSDNARPSCSWMIVKRHRSDWK